MFVEVPSVFRCDFPPATIVQIDRAKISLDVQQVSSPADVVAPGWFSLIKGELMIGRLKIWSDHFAYPCDDRGDFPSAARF